MNIAIKPQINVQNAIFISANKPAAVIPQASNIGTIPANLSPAYFHPSFKGGAENVAEFSKLLDSAIANPSGMNDALSQKMESLLNSIISIIKQNNINSGLSSHVHKLDDNYVIKFPLDEDPEIKGFKINHDKLCRILKLWHGGVVAKTGNISIMKNADPKGIMVPVGIPFGLSFRDPDKISSYYNQHCLPKLVNMPQEAFDKVADDFATLMSYSKEKNSVYRFDDINPNNFLLVENEIKIVDEIENNEIKSPNDLWSMINVFVGKINFMLYARQNVETEPQKRLVLKKCILASEKAQLNSDISTLSGYEKQYINNALQICGIKNTDCEELAKQLNDIRQKNPDMSKRLSDVSEYLDSLK